MLQFLMNGPHTILKQHINQRIQLTDEEAQIFLGAFRPKQLIKKQYVIQPDFIATHRNFVCQGAMCAFVLDEKGQEHTIQLAIEDWWITDYNSYIYQQPATMFVMALEKTTILQLSYEKEQELKQAHPKFESFFRIMAERSTAYMQRRVIQNLLLNAEARYGLFLQKYPEIAARVPQYMQASYLGMTSEFLSRLRAKRRRP